MIGAAIRKDALLLLKDRGALASLFLLPLVFIGVFGSVFNGGTGGPAGLDVAVFAEGAGSRELADHLGRENRVHVQAVASESAARRAVLRGEAAAGLVLPEDFAPLLGRPGRLFVDREASPQERVAVEGALSGLLAKQAFGKTVGALLEVEVAQRGRTRELASGFQISVPGNAVLFGFFLALTVALSFLEDRRSGVFRRLLSSPASPRALLVAKLVPFLLVGCIQMVVLFGFGALALGLEVGHCLPGLLLLSLSVVFCAVSLGLFIASFGGSEKQVGAVGSVSLLVMGLLGGAMVPRMFMPRVMKDIGLATPQAWALEGYHELLVGGAESVQAVLGEIGAVAAFGVAFAVFGAARFRFA